MDYTHFHRSPYIICIDIIPHNATHFNRTSYIKPYPNTFCHFHHIGHTFSYRIAETHKSNVTSLQIERRGALCQSTEKTSERGKMVVGRVAILRDESLIGPQSGGTFTDIPTPRLRKDSLLKKWRCNNLH